MKEINLRNWATNQMLESTSSVFNKSLAQQILAFVIENDDLQDRIADLERDKTSMIQGIGEVISGANNGVSGLFEDWEGICLNIGEILLKHGDNKGAE